MSYLAVIFIFVVNKKFYLVTTFGIFIMFITQKKKKKLFAFILVMRILKDKIITEIIGQQLNILNYY